MRNKRQVRKKLEFYESFGENGHFPFIYFKECMWAIVLKRVLKLKNYNKKVITQQLKELITNLEENKANLRGLADTFELQAYLWILKKKELKRN